MEIIEKKNENISRATRNKKYLRFYILKQSFGFIRFERKKGESELAFVWEWQNENRFKAAYLHIRDIERWLTAVDLFKIVFD